MTPSSGPAAGGNLVTIVGANFCSATGVQFGGGQVVTNFIVNADGTTLTVDAPPGSGVVDTNVSTPQGHSNQGAPDRYSYQPPPATPYTSAKLSLSPATAGPDVPHVPQTLKATLSDRNGKPLPNMLIPWAASGANHASGTAATDATGVATFAYAGTVSGTDTVTATFTAGADRATSNRATIDWAVPSTPIQSVSTTSVDGHFYPGGCGSFCADVTKSPLWTQTFPTIDFNPPGGTVPGNTSGVNVNTRPFTDISTDAEGNYTGSIVAQGNGLQAGTGSVSGFDATFTGSYKVATKGDVTFNFYSDDGFVLGVSGGATRVGGANANAPSATPLMGYPVMGAYNGPTSPVANQITVHFPAAGDYPFEVDYSECCGGSLSLTMANSAGHAIAPANNLSLGPKSPPNQTVGHSLALTTQALDKFGQPVAGLHVEMTVQGANPQIVQGTTNQDGLATLSYLGTNVGADTVQVAGSIDGTPVVSNTVSVSWAFAPGSSSPPPVIGALSPSNGSVVTAPTPVTASFTPPSGQTIASWSVTATLDAAGSSPTTLARGNGTPAARLATFDPTLLTNGTYTIAISATASGGGTQTANADVAVTGNLKLGRYVTTYQDLSVPVNGFQMDVRRTYDSTDKTVGDFGVGWRLSLANFRITTNRQLGAGGWSQYDPACFGALCLTAYKTSAPHFVTVTFPDSHSEVFDFTPTGGSVLFPSVGPAFTARPGTGTTSTLSTSEGIQGLTANGDLVDGNGNPYDPQRFTLTTHDGRVLTLDRTLGLVSESDLHGNTLTVDTAGVHASNGQSLDFTRDGSGRVTDVTGPSGPHLHYDYSPAGDLSGSVDPRGETTSYAYDANHDLSRVTGADGKPIQTLNYGLDGRLQGVTDPAGHRLVLHDDPSSRIQTSIDPAGRLTTINGFDSQGDLIHRQLVAATGPSQVDSFTYDGEGRMRSSTDTSGATTTASYDTAGDVVSSTDPAGRSTAVTWNALGQPTAVTDAVGAVVQTATYTAAGDLAEVDHPDGSKLAIAYDSAGRPTSTTDAAGGMVSYTYDGAGHLVRSTDALGHSTLYVPDSSGHLTAGTDPSGATTAYTVAADGTVTGLTDALGHKWSFGYDALGRMTSSSDPLGSTARTAYSLTGQVQSETDRNGRVTTYSYDADGALTSASSPNETTTIARDDFGRPTAVTNATATVTFAYDLDGRVLGETTAGAPGTGIPTTWQRSTYDSSGGLATKSGPGGASSYTYDGNGRMASVGDPAGRVFIVGHDVLSRVTALARPDGTDEQFGYDRAGNLISQSDIAGQTPVATWSVVRDGDGRIATRQTLTGSSAFGYDAVGRLISAGGDGLSGSYAYDAVGNRTASSDQPSGTATFDADNRLIADGTSTYAYDADGRVKAQTARADGAVTTFDWGANGQLKAVHRPQGNTVSFAYDPFGRRVETVAGGQPTYLAWDDQRLAATFNSGSTAPASSYVGLPGGALPLEQDRGGTTSMIVDDGQGNVVAATDLSGHVVGRSAYSAFGQPLAGSQSPSPFGFAGQYSDPAVGLSYDRAREYDPSQGRFLSPDPVFRTNSYPYTGDDPINHIDPSGALIAEYAPLLPQQTKGALAIGKINQCLSLALLVGLDGNSERAQDLLRHAFDHYRELIPVPPQLLNGGKVDDSRRAVIEQADQLNGVHEILGGGGADSAERSVFIPPSGGADPALWAVETHLEKPWPSPDGPIPRVSTLSEEPPKFLGGGLGTASDAFSLLDVSQFLRGVANFSCPTD